MSDEDWFRDTLEERKKYYEIPAIKEYVDTSVQDWHDFYNYPLLIWFVLSKRLDLVKLLLEAGAKPNVVSHIDTMSPLQYITTMFYNNKIKMCKLLLKYGADPNFNHKHGTPLYNAVLYEDTKVVKLLLKYGADPYIKNSRGYSTLHYAHVFRQKKIVELFLKPKQKPYFKFLQQYFCSDIAKYISKYC